MVLRGDLDPPGLEVLHGMVAAPVAEFEFVGPGAVGEGKDLVPQANSEDRDLPDQLADGLYRLGDVLRIARAVGEKHAVWL